MSSVQNPLENILVVTNLAKFFKLKELKNFRLVSPVWNAGSKQQFQNQSCVSIRDTNIIRPYLHENISVFINFKFLNVPLYGKNKRRIVKLFDKIGPSVKEITFAKCFGDYMGILGNLENLSVMSIVLPGSFDDFPQDYEEHMRQNINKPLAFTLPLKCLEVTGSSNVDAHLVNWANFIEAFPHLEILGAQCRFSEDLTELLSALTSHPPLKKLSDFSCVLIDLHNSHLEILATLQVNFHSLDLSLSENIDPYYLITLLRNHSLTLKNLKLYRDSEKSLICLSTSLLPVPLNCLTSLDIQCNMVDSFEFLNLTPNLKTLNLSQFGDGEVSFYNSIVKNTKPSFEGLFSLQSFSYEYFLAPDCVQKICKFFPQLKRLSTYLTDDSIQIVFRDMGSLEELTVLGTQLSDEGVTGVPLHILERKYKFMKDYRKFPYIGNLTRLRRFVLYPQPQEKITDLSVTYGFLETENLSSIEIPETAITNKGIEALQQKSNLVTLTSPFYTRSGNVYNRPGDLQELRPSVEQCDD